MKSDGLARSVILLATVLALPSNVWAQRLSYGAGEGTFHYEWSNMGAVGQGDTLVVRRVLINTADSVTPVPVPICGIELVTSVAVRALGEDCSAPTEVLSPGDSVWAEYRWIVQSASGEYEYEIRTPAGPYIPGDVISSSGSWQVPASTPRGSRAKPPNRLPIVLRTVIEPSDSHVTERDLQSVIGHVVSRSACFPVFVSDEAASAMQTIARRLQLHIEVGPKGDFAFESCWFDREGEQLPRDCDARTSGQTSPMMLGVLLRDFVDRELEWVGRRARQPRPR